MKIFRPLVKGGGLDTQAIKQTTARGGIAAPGSKQPEIYRKLAGNGERHEI